MKEVLPGSTDVDTAQSPLPAEIFGFSTDAAMSLGIAMSRLGPASPRLSKDGRVLQGMLELFPLLERVQAGEKIEPLEVRPYDDSIKKVVSPLHAANEIIKSLGIIPPVGRLGRAVLNRVIETEFTNRVPEALARAAEYIPRVEPYAMLLASFDNPRQQLVDEIREVNNTIHDRITRLGGYPGAREVATGIHEVLFVELLPRPHDYRRTLPMIAGSLAIKSRYSGPNRIPAQSLVAVVASEILTMFNAVLPKDEQDYSLIEDAKARPVAARSMANLIKRKDIEALGQAAPALLPSVRDLLPRQGSEVTERFEAVKKFLTPKP